MKNKKEILENNIETNFEEIISDRFSRYSKYIIQERALPDARDGLKPVQRRILYAMYYDGNTHEKQYRKSAKSVGLIIGNFHPHGDSSVYDAMVRMSQSWKNNKTLIDMHGNNGSIDDDPPAAMRYTEARLSEFSSILLKDIDNETVSWSMNFDDTLLEPNVLPAEAPLLLINGSTGIAAGYATNIPPHNLNEVIDATIYRIKNPECSIDELLNYISGPDFPTKAIIQGKEGLKNAYKTGKGRIVVRSKCEIDDKNNQIIIKEIPYEVVKSNLVKKIDELRISKTVEAIIDVRDESGRDGLKIVIDIKKGQDINNVLKYLYKNTELQVYYNFNMVSIINERPTITNLALALDSYIKHKKQVVYNRSKFLKDKKEARCHILDGLIKAVGIMDDIIELIRRSQDKNDAKQRIIEAFLFTDLQAEAIVNLRLYRLSNTDILELRQEFSLLSREIFELNQIIENQDILIATIINELKDVKKRFNSPRLTVIENEIEDINIEKQAMIVNERVMISVSKDAYVRRSSLRSFNSTKDLGGLKQTDELIGIKEVDNIDNLLFFTNFGNYGYIPIYELEESKWKDIGTHISSYCKLEANEKIIDCFVISNFETYDNIVLLTKKGLIKKINVKSLEITRFNKVYTAIKFRSDDELVAAKQVSLNDDLIIVTQNAMCSYYENSKINLSGLKSTGSKAINLAEDDLAISLVVLKENLENLVLFTDKGNNKRIKIDNLTKTNRPVKGFRLAKHIKTNPQLIKYALAKNNNDILAFYNQNYLEIEAKDVTLMELDASFSTINNMNEEYFLIKGIQSVEIINQAQEEDVYKQLEIFE